MPTTKTRPATTASDLDIDCAQLGEPLSGQDLDLLSDVIDLRDALPEAVALVHRMQAAIEAGRFDLALRDQIGEDLIALGRIYTAVAIRVHDFDQ